MKIVLLSLLPTAVVGVVVHGLNALAIILLSMGTAVLCEWIFDLICHKPNSIGDGSAAVTGLLLALSLSPSVPLYIPVLGAAFAIIVAKCCFGGLGKNFINPALAGRCFLLISFGKVMNTFAVDGVSSATPLAVMAEGGQVDLMSMFLGTSNGVIGGSILAMVIGGLALWCMDIIHGQICFSVLGGFTVFMAIFGGHGLDPKYLLSHLCGGGVVMGAFFMATDYVTSPVSRLGQLVYGLVIGVLGGLFRLHGSTPDSFSYSIIVANLLTPFIDTYVVAKPYAYRKTANHRAVGSEGEKKNPLQRIPKPVIVLTVITIVAGLALSGVFSMTRQTIEDQDAAAARASFQVVCPGAETFEETEAITEAIAGQEGGVYGTSFGRCKINEAYLGRDAAGNTVGYVVSVTTSDGFDGNITLALGVNADGVVNGISFTELHETAGMGMRADEEAFKGQFAGKSDDPFQMTKSGEAGAANEIEAISGASVTSRAVVNAVNAGLDFYASVMKGGN